jgi:hypothetical protein
MLPKIISVTTITDIEEIKIRSTGNRKIDNEHSHTHSLAHCLKHKVPPLQTMEDLEMLQLTYFYQTI